MHLRGIEAGPGIRIDVVDVDNNVFNTVDKKILITATGGGGGAGDYMDSLVICNPTPLQTSVNLDLIVDGNWIKYSPSGPGTGTHGFADPTLISVIPRLFQGDGDWNYDGTSLTPNLAGTGNYNISATEQTVSKYMNKIPTYGTSSYFTMSSDETTELPANFFIKVRAHNVSDTTWSATAIMEIYREKTVEV